MKVDDEIGRNCLIDGRDICFFITLHSVWSFSGMGKSPTTVDPYDTRDTKRPFTAWLACFDTYEVL